MTRVLELSAQAAGGVRAHIRQVSQLLAKDGHQVLLAGPSNVILPAPGAVGGACLRTYQIDIGARPSGADLKALRQLKQLAATVEVIHAHGLRAGALAVLAAKRLPAAKRPRVVVTLHNLPVGSAPTRLVGQALHLVVVKGADYVLTVSPDLLEKAKQLGLKAGEIAVVPAPARGCADCGCMDRAAQRTEFRRRLWCWHWLWCWRQLCGWLWRYPVRAYHCPPGSPKRLRPAARSSHPNQTTRH